MNLKIKDYTKLQIKILKLLTEKGPLNRLEITSNLSSTRSTVYRHLDKLVEKKLIIKFKRRTAIRGRYTVFFKIDEEFNWE